MGHQYSSSKKIIIIFFTEFFFIRSSIFLDAIKDTTTITSNHERVYHTRPKGMRRKQDAALRYQSHISIIQIPRTEPKRPLDVTHLILRRIPPFLVQQVCERTTMLDP